MFEIQVSSFRYGYFCLYFGGFQNQVVMRIEQLGAFPH